MRPNSMDFTSFQHNAHLPGLFAFGEFVQIRFKTLFHLCWGHWRTTSKQRGTEIVSFHSHWDQTREHLLHGQNEVVRQLPR